MGRGKYSLVYKYTEKGFNSKGMKPEIYDPQKSKVNPEHYVLSSDHFDSDGYDHYGYSCYDRQGKFVGDGEGIDRAGWTEMDYLTLQDIPEEHRSSYYYYNS
mgnify:CR=1 FL=1